MERFKLWAFYQIMAWNSLIHPSDGQEMIDLSHKGRAERDRAAIMKAVFSLAKRSKRD